MRCRHAPGGADAKTIQRSSNLKRTPVPVP